jgi:hypothetical protein
MSNDPRNLSRRNALQGLSAIAARATAPISTAAAVTAVAAITAGDPLRDAVAAYKAAVRERCRTARLCWEGGAFEHLTQKQALTDPASVEATRIADEAFDREWECCDLMFETSPTTLAGVADFLETIIADPYEPYDGAVGNPISTLQWAINDGEGYEMIRDCFTEIAAALRQFDKRTAGATPFEREA